jgi:hypothetical protein
MARLRVFSQQARQVRLQNLSQCFQVNGSHRVPRTSSVSIPGDMPAGKPTLRAARVGSAHGSRLTADHRTTVRNFPSGTSLNGART